MIRSMAQPIFAEYIGKYQIKAIDFETLSLGTLPPVIYGEKIPQLNIYMHCAVIKQLFYCSF
jgi:hypothetical protein